MAVYNGAIEQIQEAQSIFWPFAISFAVHVLLMIGLLMSPDFRPQRPYRPSVIDVQMVDLAPTGAADKKPAGKKADVTVKSKKTATKKAPVKSTVAPADKPSKKAVSLAPPKKKPKTSLKRKTFKSSKVLENAIKKLERHVETSPPKPLADTLKQLKQKVDQTPAPKAKTDGQQQGVAVGGADTKATGDAGGQKAELIYIYQVEVAFQIEKNWAFNQQLAGGRNDLVASIVFKVLPDGQIQDIFFTDRSGNAYLDESGYKAIIKSNPVKPHPAGLNLPYVQMGIRFTPEGVR